MKRRDGHLSLSNFTEDDLVWMDLVSHPSMSNVGRTGS